MRNKMIVAAICLLVFGSGCGTFQERLDVYRDIYAELKPLSPVVAKVFLADQVEKGRLTEEEAAEIIEAIKDL